jgi:two-component system, NarL family, nitrate/nitrite response regulator NarL
MPPLTIFPPQNTIRVLAADSTSMNTQMLVETLARDGQFTVSGSASKPAEILAWTKKEHPHVALISARLEEDGTGGFELCRNICSSSPATRMIMLLDSSERTTVIEAFRSGARGVFFRTESLRLLAKSILCVHAGQVWAASSELHYLLEAIVKPLPMRFTGIAGKSLLSTREMDVVRCVAEGLSNREIAQRLTLREHTVKNYLFRIFDKLGVSSRVEVVLYALSGADAPAMTPTASKAIPRPKQVPTVSPLVARANPPFAIARH